MRMISSVRFLSVAIVAVAMSMASFAQVNISVTVGPPALPVYDQPICPGDGYMWTPGYWAYGDDDYYWVPGTWVMAPEVGFLWTPGYWGWGGDRFIFNDGYWGPHVGFYGGISYGFGYFGDGYQGGRWDNGSFFYNRSVNNVNIANIHNVYNTTVVNETVVNRVSYNGGNGGINAHATAEQESYAHERHLPPVAAQNQHEQEARSDPQQRASVNHGRPAVAATPRPGVFNDSGAVRAKEAGAPYTPANRNAAPESSRSNVPRPEDAVHPNELPARERPAPPNTGNAKLDKKYQHDQDKLSASQDKERQKLQQKQEQDHQNLTRQKADDSQKQQLEKQHQQQTQQLQQKHTQQQQQLQARQQPANRAQPRPER